MKIVVSPAKSLDFESKVPTNNYTQGVFLEQAEKLSNVLKKKSPKDLSALMKISDKLGELNWQRNQDWVLPFTPENARQAVFAFNGDVYTGLDAYTLKEEQIDVLQDKLRILSGQYGILKPLDLMQPYRLEMGTKLKINTKNNLYEFWGDTVTQKLNEELSKDELFLNLASNEYFKVVKPKVLKTAIITPEFKDYKDGKLKIISFYAKKARGLMVRYIIDHNIETLDGLKGFDCEGYAFDANLSTETDLVFTR
ncbi:peroxide stress protein YaaA [Wenyingzhuangia sp. 2_MG-2023]|uniref:peroxide stress protein YaaA n=1 Tax=Wenyingzhuangia sp. 2_MG-2023 TaxID=3062639 RepID=UPI0026E1DDF3|nr:peroxide stress protein YaaA [Wenyingzhuangia sp. 2_MG-2023]MDO6737189.1 peroxide stress protein YaaA [Wenyingzhuangia sp. 2_MG-2023]MDO6801733.1 peroxide stress protein YaaA [Wenyingzhuangia sp. 1_MG-2023]